MFCENVYCKNEHALTFSEFDIAIFFYLTFKRPIFSIFCDYFISSYFSSHFFPHKYNVFQITVCFRSIAVYCISFFILFWLKQLFNFVVFYNLHIVYKYTFKIKIGNDNTYFPCTVWNDASIWKYVATF